MRLAAHLSGALADSVVTVRSLTPSSAKVYTSKVSCNVRYQRSSYSRECPIVCLQQLKEMSKGKDRACWICLEEQNGALSCESNAALPVLT